MTDPERWLAAAFHEAGHCCAYLYYGWEFESVEVYWEPDTGVANGALTPAVGVPKDLLEYAVSCAAGPISEARYTGESDWLGLAEEVGKHDLRMVRDALARVPDAPSLLEIGYRATAILQREWNRVERGALPWLSAAASNTPTTSVP